MAVVFTIVSGKYALIFTAFLPHAICSSKLFLIISAAIEWLNNKWDSILKEREDEAERKRIAEEEAEHVIIIIKQLR